MSTYYYEAGTIPLLISMPHNGHHIPANIARRMTPYAATSPDTDWHMDRLYKFVAELGAYIIRPYCSRFVIDLNRPPDNKALYPGAENTELCPSSCFDETPIYRSGQNPSLDEIEDRRESYWQPYHDQLASTLQDIREKHHLALLYDAHSIRSLLPRFFLGRLPDLNLGTGSGTSCDMQIGERLSTMLENQKNFSHVLNGRFKGGYITRHYGDPSINIHAIQMEQAQITYMNENPPYNYLPEKAEKVIPILRSVVEVFMNVATDL